MRAPDSAPLQGPDSMYKHHMEPTAKAWTITDPFP